MEKEESLLYKNYRILQDRELGCFTEDSTSLVHFLMAKPHEKGMDLGTGNGIIPIYANALYGCSLGGLDTNEKQLALAKRSASLNGQEIPFYLLDVRDAAKTLGYGAYDLVTVNPPYFSADSAGPLEERAAQRHGDLLRDFLEAAFALLNNGGRVCLCYRAFALARVLSLMEELRLEPKRLMIRYGKNGGDVFFVEGKKLGKTGIVVQQWQGQNNRIT